MKEWYVIEGKNKWDSALHYYFLILEELFGKADKIQSVTIRDNNDVRSTFYLLDYINVLYVLDSVTMHQTANFMLSFNCYEDFKKEAVKVFKENVNYRKTTRIEWEFETDTYTKVLYNRNEI